MNDRQLAPAALLAFGIWITGLGVMIQDLHPYAAAEALYEIAASTPKEELEARFRQHLQDSRGRLGIFLYVTGGMMVVTGLVLFVPAVRGGLRDSGDRSSSVA